MFATYTVIGAPPTRRLGRTRIHTDSKVYAARDRNWTVSEHTTSHDSKTFIMKYFHCFVPVRATTLWKLQLAHCSSWLLFNIHYHFITIFIFQSLNLNSLSYLWYFNFHNPGTVEFSRVQQCTGYTVSILITRNSVTFGGHKTNFNNLFYFYMLYFSLNETSIFYYLSN